MRASYAKHKNISPKTEAGRQFSYSQKLETILTKHYRQYAVVVMIEKWKLSLDNRGPAGGGGGDPRGPF